MSVHTTALGVEIKASTATPKSASSLKGIASTRLPEPSHAPKSKWDIAQLRLPQDYAAASPETVQASIPVGKPGPHTFFQVHSEWQIPVATLAHEDSLYLVSTGLRDALEGDTRIKLVVPYITRDGDVGFWPMNPLQATGRTDEWTASAHRALVAARKGWVRMRSNMRTRSYDLIRPKVTWEEPVWPDQDFESLLEAALGDRVIDTLDHPVVRALAGEA